MPSCADHVVSDMTSGQTWSADGYDRHARFVSDLGGEIFNWLAPAEGERILDLGCGDGDLTKRIRDAGAAVIGVDTSADLLAAARDLGLDVREMDGQTLTFDGEFDAVFSSAALHWMRDADAVAVGVRRALKPGGRFVAEFGGHGNMAAVVTAMRAAATRFGGDPGIARPWYFPTPDEYSDLLARHGFDVQRCVLAPRPTPLPTGMEGWLETFRGPFFDQFGSDQRSAAVSYVVQLLEPSLKDAVGRWTADYVRLRVEARLPRL